MIILSLKQHNWDLFHCGVFKDFDVPAATIGYNMGFIMKVCKQCDCTASHMPAQPYNWWTTVIEPPWDFLNIRKTIVCTAFVSLQSP